MATLTARLFSEPWLKFTSMFLNIWVVHVVKVTKLFSLFLAANTEPRTELSQTYPHQIGNVLKYYLCTFWNIFQQQQDKIVSLLWKNWKSLQKFEGFLFLFGKICFQFFNTTLRRTVNKMKYVAYFTDKMGIFYFYLFIQASQIRTDWPWPGKWHV